MTLNYLTDFGGYYLFPKSAVYIHVKLVRWAGSLEPVCHKGHSLYAKARIFSWAS